MALQLLLWGTRWRRNDVRRFQGLEVVIGLNNLYLAVGGNVNPLRDERHRSSAAARPNKPSPGDDARAL